MKEVNDTFYVDMQRKIKELKIVEQCDELKQLLYSFKSGFILKRCPYTVKWSDIGIPDITIYDNRYWSLKSMGNSEGAMVAQFHPFDRIEVYDKNILNVVHKFGEKWKYNQLVKKWAEDNSSIKNLKE